MNENGAAHVRLAILLLTAAAIVVVALTLVWRRAALPGPGSPAYEDITRAFYTGLAALQVGLLENAVGDFTQATTIVPEEPAGWANLGVARLRLGDLEAAAEPITQALALEPDHAGLELLAARMEIARGGLDAGIAHLRRAVALDPGALRARFALAEELERSGAPEGGSEALTLLDELQQLAPGNLAVIIERARVAATLQDAARLRDAVSQLAGRAPEWPDIAITQYEILQQAASAGDFTQAARGTALLRNVLARVPAYTNDLLAVRTPAELVAEPFDDFIRLPAPEAQPAPPDAEVAFAAEPIDGQPASIVTLVPFSDEGPPAVLAVAGSEIRRIGPDGGAWPFPGDASVPAEPGGVLPLDWNNDFRVDLIAAGSAGIRLYLQSESGALEDRTAEAAAAAPVSCDCRAAWPADLDLDGDLDLVLGVRAGATIVLRNNGDVTWAALDVFAGADDALDFAWADLDADGDPDAALLTPGAVRLFRNDRGGAFAPIDAPPALRDAGALAVADIDANGRFDLLGVDASGRIHAATLGPENAWSERELLAAGELPAGERVTLLAADLDNNGALDLIRSAGTQASAWLADERHQFQPLAASLDAAVMGIADMNGDGRLDLIGVRETPIQLTGRGAAAYHWKQVRVRAQPTAGDQRINPFAVGGEIEVRSGLLRQKQLLTGAPAHFGLGARTTIDLARIVWPNGIPQAEFGIEVDDTIVAEQRLKGSCPWVFAYDGTAMTFVTDFLWRSPLGLRINAQDTAGVSQTEDWVRIGGDQLAPRDGVYDIRITAELWETHFFDHVALLAVDHPDGTDVFVDERFSASPVDFTIRTVHRRQAVTAARDHRGQDVTTLVSARDGRHLASFDRGHYQGIAREHFVEFEPADRAPLAPGERLVLLAHGWVYPTDSSINLAVGQGSRDRPRGVSLEYRTADGRWKVAHGDLGFPAGKNKTMVIALDGVEGAARLRLRTNMEIAWDAIETARTSAAAVRQTRLQPATATLRYRGYSRTASPRGSSPETPVYAPIAASGQQWRDLVGYYTRFGDVRELLASVDDRYVIMNAGDEMALEFPVPPAPPAGWTRDFVLIGDGWEKDGDFNTEFSAGVLPLPAHGAAPYDRSVPPTTLEADPVYQRHPGDWETFHTRYVRPSSFSRGLGR